MAQNITALNEARKNQANQERDVNDSGSRAGSQKKLDLSEFLMWETGLTIFWLVLAGWVPFWGGVVNALLIGVIYIWYAGHDLNPPSFSPAKATQFAGQKEEIIKKIPGGGTLLFILAVLSGGVGIIPTPMVLFFSIYMANSESSLLKLAPKQGGTKLTGDGKLAHPQANLQKIETQKQSPVVKETMPPTVKSNDEERLRGMRMPEQTRPDWMYDKRAAEGAGRDQERFDVAKRLGMDSEDTAKRAMDIREKE